MNLTEEEIKKKIRTFLKKYIKKNIKDDQNLFTSGLVSSLFAMQMVLFIEKDFKIKVENQDLDLKNFNTVNAIGGFIERKMKEN